MKLQENEVTRSGEYEKRVIRAHKAASHMFGGDKIEEQYRLHELGMSLPTLFGGLGHTRLPVTLSLTIILYLL